MNTSGFRTGTAETLAEILPRVITDIQTRKPYPEFPICVPRVDQVAWGWPKGRISVVSARPSHGKTAFMLQNAWSNALAGKNVLFLSLEDTREQLTESKFTQPHKSA